MRSQYIIILLLFLTLSTNGLVVEQQESPVLIDERVYQSNSVQYLFNCQTDQGMVVAYQNMTAERQVVLDLFSQGELLWSTTQTVDGESVYVSISGVAASDDHIVIGYATSVDNGTLPSFLVFDNQGHYLRKFDSEPVASFFFDQKLQVTPDDHILATYLDNSVLGIVTKTNMQGEQIWQATVNNSDGLPAGGNLMASFLDSTYLYPNGTLLVQFNSVFYNDTSYYNPLHRFVSIDPSGKITTIQDLENRLDLLDVLSIDGVDHGVFSIFNSENEEQSWYLLDMTQPLTFQNAIELEGDNELGMRSDYLVIDHTLHSIINQGSTFTLEGFDLNSKMTSYRQQYSISSPLPSHFKGGFYPINQTHFALVTGLETEGFGSQDTSLVQLIFAYSPPNPDNSEQSSQEHSPLFLELALVGPLLAYQSRKIRRAK